MKNSKSSEELAPPKPLLRWAGSKRKLIPTVKRLLNTEETDFYIEPFCGSATLFFELKPKKAFLSDINIDLINFLRTVKYRPNALFNSVSKFVIEKDQYQKLRNTSPDSLPATDRAARFLYLNRFCFNGLYRTNRQGQFNVPWGGNRKNGTLPSLESLRFYSTCLKNAEIKAIDFFPAIENNASKGSTIYLDPPYATSSKRTFSYSSGCFSVADLDRLSKVLELIDTRGAKFVCSYADLAEFEYIRKGWNSYSVSVQRNIAGFAGARKLAKEWVLTNF